MCCVLWTTLGYLPVFAQKPTIELMGLERQVEALPASLAKMPCDPASSPITIVSCEGETPINGDEDPSDGAFMEWVATGTNNLYFSRIYNGTDTFNIVRPGTSSSVYPANEPDGVSYRGRLAIGGSGAGSNACLQPGTWTVQVWDVMDADGDLEPDVGPDGGIIGCFTECSYTFFPSCPSTTNPPFTVDVRDLGCNGTGGYVNLLNFQTADLYCVDGDGGGASFSWTGPDGFTATTRDVDNLAPGIYTVAVMDFYGCTSFWTRNIVQLDDVAMTCSPVSGPSIFGASDGSFSVDIFSGSGDYTISWTGPVSGMRNNAVDGINTVSGLPAGSYTVTVTDVISSCSEMCTIVLPDPPCVIDFSVSEDNIGNIIITILDGTPDYFVSYTGPTFRDDIGPFDNGGLLINAGEFEIGEYVFTVYEAGRPDCSEFRFYEIPGPDCSDLTFTLNELRQISCHGRNDGRIEISFTGDHSPVIFWTGPGVDGSNTTSLDNLGPGNYAYQINDSRGCFLEGDFDIIDPPTLLFTCDRANETLPDNDDGRIWFDISGGTAGYSISYVATDQDGNALPSLTDRPVMSGDTLFNLPAGTYQITLQDANGCTQNCTAIIDQPICDLAMSGGQTDISCFGEDDGIITLDISGAGTGLQIDWNVDALDGRDTVEQLSPGNYSVTISDDTGCPVAPLSFTIAEPDTFFVDLMQTEPINCFGEETARIEAVTSGSQGTLSFQWSVGGVGDNNVAGNLPAGSYAITVTDSLSCTALDDIMVSQPALLTLNCGAVAETSIGLADGVVGFSLSGGRAPYRFSLNGQPVARPPMDSFRALSPGNYRIDILDANECSVTCNAVVNAGGCGDFTVTVSAVQPDCNLATGSATASPMAANGTVRYLWSNNETTATVTGLLPGGYTVTATDIFGCEAIGQVTFNVFENFPRVSLAAFNQICEDDCSSIAYVAEGTFPFQLSFVVNQAQTQVPETVEISSANSLLEFCPGDFGLSTLAGSTIDFLAVTDANGCSRDVNESREVSPFPPALGSLDTTLCRQDTLRYFGEIFHLGRMNDDVTIPLPSVNGCDSTVSVSLTFFAPALGALDTTLCAGDTLRYFNELFHAGRTNDEVIIPLPSVNGCDSTVSVSLTFFAPALGALDTMLCTGDTLRYFDEIFHAGRTNDEVIIPLPSVNGCDSTVAVSLDFYPLATSTIDTLICEGDFFFVGSVRFDGPTNNQIVILAGASGQGCDSLVSVSVGMIALPEISISGDGFICTDGLLDITLNYDGTGTATVELSSQPGEFFQITPGQTVIERMVVAGTTISILSASDDGPCAPITSGSIQVETSDLELRIEVTSGDGLYAVSCPGESDGSLLATPSGDLGPYTYEWSTGENGRSLDGLSAGVYSLIVTSSRGCQDTAQAALFAPPVLVASIDTLPASCLQPSPQIILRDIAGGTGPYLYSINDQNGFRQVGSLPNTIDAIVGTTRFQLEDSRGCRLAENFSFAPPPTGEIVVTPGLSVITRGDSVRLQVLTDLNADQYLVSPGSSEPISSSSFFVAPEITTTYEITAIDELGCTTTTTAKVVVDRYVPVYIPNAFSPNGDGVNDTYRIYGRKEVVSFSNFAIFNRWGQQVYILDGPVSPQDVNWGWDGTTQEGRLHEQGVYVFTITVTFANGTTQTFKGDLVLMR